MPNNKKFSPDQIEAANSLVKKNSTNVAADQVFVETSPTSVGQVLTISGLNTGSHSAEWQAPSGGPPSGAAGGDLSGAYPNPMVDKIEGKDVPSTVADRILKVNAANTAFEFVPYGTGANTVAQGNHTHDATAIITGQLALARGGTSADLSATGGANQFVKQTSAGGAFSVGLLGAGDVPTAALPIVPTSKGGLGQDASATTGVPVEDAPGVFTIRNLVANDVVDLDDTQTFLAVGTVDVPKNHARCDASGGSFALTLGAPGSYASRFVGGGGVWVHKFTAANVVTVTPPVGDTINGAATFPLAGISGAYFFRPDSGTDWHVGAVSSGGGGGPHDLLSATHTDTNPNAVVRGAIITGQGAVAWGRLLLGPVGQYLRSDGTDLLYSALLASDLSGTVSVTNGGTGANLSATGGASQYVKQAAVGVPFTVGTIPAGDLPGAIPAIKISSGLVDNTEFDYLNGVTSNVQTQLDGKVPTSRILNGTAPIRIDGGAFANLSADRTISVNDATGLANGVIRLANHLGGAAAAPTVTGIQETGGPTSLTIGAIAAGEILVRSGATIIGQTGAAPSGSASGDLSGTYPGPKVVALTDLSLTSFPIGTFNNGDYVAVSAGSVTGSSKILKTPVRLVEVFPSALVGLGPVDGIPLVVGDRILVTANGAANGIYKAAIGAWTRDVEFDSGADAVTGLLITVENGLRFTGWIWQHVTLPPIIFGVTPLVFKGISTGVDFSVTGGVDRFVQQSAAGAVLTVAQPTMAQIANTATYLKSEVVTMFNGTHTTGAAGVVDAAYLTVDPASMSAGTWTIRWNQTTVPATSCTVRLFDNTGAVVLFSAVITTTGLKSGTFSMPVVASELIFQNGTCVGAGSSTIRGASLTSPV